MKVFRYRFMRVSNIKAIYKVMIERLVLTLRFPFESLLWFGGRRKDPRAYPEYKDLKHPCPLFCWQLPLISDQT